MCEERGVWVVLFHSYHKVVRGACYNHNACGEFCVLGCKASHAMSRTISGWTRSPTGIGLQGVLRLYLPASSDPSDPEEPMSLSLMSGELQYLVEREGWSSNCVGDDSTCVVRRKCSTKDRRSHMGT
jgi:hypothetical protein